jgi:chromosome segregation ATPase
MTQKTYAATMVAMLLTVGQVGCDSKTERKAEDVAEAKQKVIEAQEVGGTKEEVMDKQADLDSARKDFKKTWDAARDDMRREINAELEDIDKKTTDYERDMQAGKGDRAKLAGAVQTLKNDRQTLTGLLKQLDQVTAANWEKTRKAIEDVKDGIDDRVDALDAN